VWNQLFGNWVSALGSISAFIGYVGLAVGITKIVREMTQAWPGHQEFRFYLYISYFVSTFLVASLIVLARQIWHHLYDSNDQRAVTMGIQHRLAEVVRRYASVAMNRPATAQRLLNDDIELHEVFGSVMKFLQKRLNRTDIVIAVKYIRGPKEDRVIDAVIRHPPQDGTSLRSQSLKADASVVYMHFLEGNRQVQRVIIEDVMNLDTEAVAGEAQASRHEAYKLYAKKCKFRSVLAFPLRQPKPLTGELEASGIIGFLSFDCPDPNAFDELFLRTSAKPTNDGRHLKDSTDLQFFFGLADSLATLAVLGAK